MEWTIVTVIIALVGLGLAIIKPIVSLTQSITKLTVVVQTLQEDMSGLTTKNSQSHARLWDHNDAQDGRLDDHERRITDIERDKGVK